MKESFDLVISKLARYKKKKKENSVGEYIFIIRGWKEVAISMYLEFSLRKLKKKYIFDICKV